MLRTFFQENFDKVDWSSLSSNSNAIDLLEKNPEKIDWDIVLFNSNAFYLLEANPEKINQYLLSSNAYTSSPIRPVNLDINPNTDWCMVSSMPDAIHLLEANLEKINWAAVWKNPAIFDIYDASVLK